MTAQAQETDSEIATNDKMVDVLLSDRCLELKKIAEPTIITEERVGHILHEILLTVSEECLVWIQRNLRDFFVRFVTEAQAWKPETKVLL